MSRAGELLEYQAVHEILDAGSDVARMGQALRNHLTGQFRRDYDAAMKAEDYEKAKKVLIAAIDNAMKEGPNSSLQKMRDKLTHGNRDASMTKPQRKMRDAKIDYMRGRY